jgi:hypothetical protein
MDIKLQLEMLKQQLEQQFESETPERKTAREKALKKLKMAVEEFDTLSQKVGTTPDQMAVISQLQQIIFKLGEIKGPEK